MDDKTRKMVARIQAHHAEQNRKAAEHNKSPEARSWFLFFGVIVWAYFMYPLARTFDPDLIFFDRERSQAAAIGAVLVGVLFKMIRLALIPSPVKGE